MLHPIQFISGRPRPTTRSTNNRVVLPLLVLMLSAVWMGAAQAQTTLSFSPSAGTVDCSDSTFVDIMIDDVTDLKGFTFTIQYDPDAVFIRSIQPGQALLDAGCSNFFEWVNWPNSPAPDDTVRVDGSLLGLDCSLDLDEPGSLVRIAFEPGANRDLSSLTFFASKLRDSSNGDITHDSDAIGSIENICNTAPVANDDSYSVDEGETLNANGTPPGVLENDTDYDSDTLSATLITGPDHATSFTLNSNGTFIYEHDGSETTADSFVYEADDGHGGTMQATATITITEVNDPPVAVDDGSAGTPLTTPEDTALEVDVLGNDSDVDGTLNPASVVVTGGPSHGTTSVNTTTGAVTYTPAADYIGADSFTYTVADDDAATSNAATVYLDVTDVNDAPVAVDDGSAGTPLTTPEDTALEVDVLGNDSDVDGTLNPASVVVTGGPSHGTTLVNTTTGAVTYTPAADYIGADSFTYTVADDDAATSNAATVYLDVTDVNDAPVAVDDGSAGTPLTTPEDTALEVDVLGNDSDVDGTLNPASVVVTGGPSHGTTLVNTTTGAVTYTPAADYIGADSFTYTVADDDAATSNAATVYLDVTDVNDAPVAVDDGSAGTPLTTPEDTALEVDVLGNDSDVDGTLNPASVVVTGGPSHGTTSVNTTTGAVTYTPAADYIGADSFTYTVADDDAATSNAATVYLDVTDVNDAPVAVDDGSAGTPLTTPEDTALEVDVLGNDSDVDGTLNPASVVVTGGPSHGTTSVNTTTGAVTYTPAADYIGADSFTYTVADDDAATSNAATVYLDVTDVNDAPVAVDDGSAGTPLTTPEDTALEVDVLGNDSDVDGTLNPASVVVTGGPSHGTTSVNTTTGAVTYTPAADYIGADSFTYTVADDDAATSNAATVYLDVTDVNDAPVAVDDGSAGTPLTTPEDTALEVDVLGNDSDVDGTLNPASVVVTGGPSHGTTSVNTTTGAVTYTPAADYGGTDSFTYTVADDDAATSNAATVYLDVTDVNDAPVAVDDGSAGTPLTTPEDTALEVDVLGNDSDVDGTLNPASVVVTGGPSHGTTSVNTTTGAVTYTPAADYGGTDSFTYTVDDDDGETSNEATVHLDVTGVNDPPVVTNPGNQTNDVLDPVSLPIVATDPESDTLSYSATGLPGGLSINPTSGLISGTIACGEDSETPYHVVVTVTDDGSPPEPEAVDFYWTVNALAEPGEASSLTAAQVKSGNDDNGTTKITLTWSGGAVAGETVRVFRKGFGAYPEYDDDGGAIPTPPTTLAQAIADVTWIEATSVAASGETDEPDTRDFWYYVAFVENACGVSSGASNMTGGTLNYHLGDVVDSVDPAGVDVGDNVVETGDVSRLGYYYALSDGETGYQNDLDVGPTTDYSLDARPTTDNEVEFEDMILFAINHSTVSKNLDGPEPASQNLLTLFVPEEPTPEGTLEVSLWMAADGDIKGASIPLTWDGDVVEPIEFAAGDLANSQAGEALVLSPEPGTVDVALFSMPDAGFSGEGLLATVTFKVLAEGDADLGIAEIRARDTKNKPQVLESTVTFGTPEQLNIPKISLLHHNYPNPFNPTTTVKYGVAKKGPVTLRLYDVRGRLVRTLVNEIRRPGTYELIWDGTDGSGRKVASGVYLARLQAVDRTQVQRMMLLK